MTKMVVFDMDGTLADLYGVENWLDYLLREDPYPYTVAAPLLDMDELRETLQALRAKGWKVAVTSWLSKGSTRDYDKKVRAAKMTWLERFDFPADELHFVKYGATKADSTRGKADFQILFDDNKKVRIGWTLGEACDESHILERLNELLT